MIDEVQEKTPFLTHGEPFATHADFPAKFRLLRPNWILRTVLVLLSSTCLISNIVWWARYRAVVRISCTRPQLVFCTLNSQATQTRLTKLAQFSKLPQLKLSLTKDGPCGDQLSQEIPMLVILAMTQR
jgi:hypothetical protein